MVKPFVSRIGAGEHALWPMIEPSHLPASSRLKRARGFRSSRVTKKSVIARARLAAGLLCFGAAAVALLTMTAVDRSFAAASAGCDGGGFTVLDLSGEQKRIVLASNVGTSFVVKGKYVEFTVDAATFGVRDWTFTGAPNPLDITGGQRTPVFASKMPNHRGLVLNSDVSVNSSAESLVLTRTGPGLSMKIQVKDCANGGVFQMEVERGDGTATVFTHVLADGVFYFDNPNVRDRLGENLPCSGILPDGTPVVCNGANPDGTVTVAARVNFANDFSDKFVGRDSPQVATRIANGCPNNIPNPFHPGSVNHCGGISQWSVASGGRMGQVMGEDSTEIAPAATVCTENCTAQNHVNGRALVVGLPFPVPTAVRLQPRFDAPAPASEAINLSTRLRVQTGDNVGIGGFIITGSSPKHVLLRAIGPSLTQSGVPNALADPVLELHGPGAFVMITNDNWRDSQAD